LQPSSSASEFPRPVRKLVVVSPPHPQLDEPQALDVASLDRIQLVGIAFGGVDGDPTTPRLHALCKRVAEREVVARAGG
jgi:hypothetical protein